MGYYSYYKVCAHERSLEGLRFFDLLKFYGILVIPTEILNLVQKLSLNIST